MAILRKTVAAATAAAAMTAVSATGAHAYTRNVPPVLVSFTCNGDGTYTYTWDKTAGKPTDFVAVGTSLNLVGGIPGSRGAKGFYTVDLSNYFDSASGSTVTGSLRTRNLTLSNAVPATCP